MLINFTAPINTTGYGISSLNILKTLQKLGHDVRLNPIGPPDLTTDEDRVAFNETRIFNQSIYAPHLILYHQWLTSNYIMPGSKNVGLSFWELDRLTEADKESLNKLDHVITPSKWAADTVQRDCKVPVSTVPMGVDREIFKSQPQYKSDQTSRFLNCGKWEVRKGHDILPELFNKAFTIKDNVELWLLTNNPFCSPQEDQKWRQLYLNTPLGRAGQIKFIPRQKSARDVANLMNLADYGIFPSRAEGWNLELLEMMACGKRCIATNYSGHTEFCQPLEWIFSDDNYKITGNCNLVSIDELEDAYDGKWFFGQGKWAKIGEKQKQGFVDCLKFYHQRAFTGDIPTVDVSQFTWENTAKQIVEILK